MLASRLRAIWAYRELVRNLVARDLRVKYKGSTLGVAWSLLHPLLIAAVYTLAVRYVLRARIEHFPVFLLSGLLPWMFLSSSLSAATGAIADNGALVRKVAFPRAILPLGAVSSQFVQFGLMFIMLVPVAILSGVHPSAALIAVVPLALLQLIFTAGLALMLATAYVFFRDTRHLVDVALQVWFWVTPIVYSLTLVPSQVRGYFLLNPMTLFVTSYQQLVLQNTLPSAPMFAALVLVATAVAAGGLFVFSAYERRFAEMV